MREEILKARDGKEISLAVWDEVNGPKGVVQIVHGMAEHMERYDDFACFLNANGYIAAGDDHRAHGKTALRGSMARPGADEGAIAFDTVGDEREITDMLKERYKLPIILLGHSYGSFLAQEYILQGTEKLSGVILSGSAHQGGLITKFGRMLARSRAAKDEHGEGAIFAKMTFLTYDKKMKEGKNAWLSRDKTEVAKYNADNMCGYTLSNGFYKSMLDMCAGMYAKKRLAALDKNFKLLITSGGCDYVGGCGKLVIKLVKNYKNAGLNNVRYKLYEGARHEILNETNKTEVYGDILKFIGSCAE